MPTFPASRLGHIAPFHVMELLGRAKQLEEQGRDVIHMEVGEPDFPTPAPILACAQAYLANGRVFYTPALGLPELRQAIAAFYATRYRINVPATRIVVTAGASAALLLALACLTEVGSEWLLPDPGYPCNRHFVRCFEGVPVAVPVFPENGFQPTVGDLEQRWNVRTAGVLLASPANPTGTLLDDCTLAAIADFVRQRHGQLIVDEIYHGLTYEHDAQTALHLADDSFIVQSFSKYFNMTGWRLGWLVVPERYLRDIERLAQNLYISPSAPAQHAALAAFAPQTMEVLEARRREFQHRRDFLVAAVQRIGLRVPAPPQGAFYVYADCSGVTDNSDRLARDLLDATGVALTPGLDFGSNQPEKYVRLAYTTRLERLAEAVERMQRFLG